MKAINIKNNYLVNNMRFWVRLIFTVICVFFITSCKKLVDIGPPGSSLVSSTVFAKDGSAISAQLSVYADMEKQLYSFNEKTGFSADELRNHSTDQLLVDIYSNNLNSATANAFGGDWGTLFNYIYRENAIIENVESSSGMSIKVKQFMRGEAFFMRAWCYFNLVSDFGGVPIILTTDYSKNSTLPRASVDQVYEQIVSDLKVASTLLSDSYLDASDNPGSPDRVRPTTWAANALLARVYLYMGKYDLAEQQSSLVIANSLLFKLVPDLTKVFKKNSNEAIWQIMPPNGQPYTYEGAYYILSAPPATNGTANIVEISPQLMNAFESNDARKISWISSYSANGTTWYFPFKYRDGGNSATLSEYSMVFRLAEQYLIRAEARAQQNNTIGALSDLNAIRNRAGLLNFAGSTDLVTLLNTINHERQVELFTENDRWYNLKRTKTVDAVMSIVTPQKTNNTWKSYQQLYPLSLSDLQYNPNLLQNPGY